MSCTDLVPVHAGDHPGRIPIAHMRSVYSLDEVEKRLSKLPTRDHESLRATYERMLEKGPERFQVKPSGLPAMAHLYDELPNFHEVLDDLIVNGSAEECAAHVRRYAANGITTPAPMVLAGPDDTMRFARALAPGA